MKGKKIQEKEKSNLQLKNKEIQKLKEQGITLIALVVTIIILLILAGVTITFALGENGIIGVAKKARKEQVIAETKEAIGLEITEAYTEAVIRKEGLEEQQVKDIVSKYGELQEDGDTIITKKDGYEISLKEIYSGVLSESGSYGAKVEQIEKLEKRVAELENENTTLKGTPRGRIDLGTEKSIDVKAKLQELGYDSEVYKSLTKENFAVEVSIGVNGAKTYTEKANGTLYELFSSNPSFSYQYSGETGMLTISVNGGKWQISGPYFENWHVSSYGSISFTTTTYLFL